MLSAAFRPGILDDRGARALIAAIVIHSIKQARSGDGQASSWLLRDGLLWLEALGLEITAEWWDGWIRSGLPGKPIYLFAAGYRVGEKQEQPVKVKTMKTSICTWCGEPTGSTSKYCSPECKEAATEQRRTSKRAARLMGRA